VGLMVKPGYLVKPVDVPLFDKELLRLCLEAWETREERKYRDFTVRPLPLGLGVRVKHKKLLTLSFLFPKFTLREVEKYLGS